MSEKTKGAADTLGQMAQGSKQFPQQITTPVVGMQVVTSTGEMFNHVDGNLPMWSGDGDRVVMVPIKFAAPFHKPPHVTVGLSGIDASHAQNLRFNISADDINVEGFMIKFVTWGDTKIGRASISWSAMGSVAPVNVQG